MPMQEKHETSTGFSKLYLGGFQVFDTLSAIPLGKLTYLFGPNSSGKSAVEDGLDLAKTIFSPLESKPERMYRFDDLYDRHWRRLSDSPKKRAPEMRIGVEGNFKWKPKSEFIENYEMHAPPAIEGSIHCIKAMFSSRLIGDWETYLVPDLTYEIRLELDGEPIAEFSEDEFAKINLCHAFFLNDGQLRQFDAAAEEFPDVFNIAPDGWLTLKPWNGLRLNQNNSFDSNELHFDWMQGRSNLIDIESVNASTYFKKFEILFNVVFTDLLMVLSSGFIGNEVVKASRKVPIEEELTFLIDHYDLNGFSVKVNGDVKYYQLATSFVRVLMNEQKVANGESVNEVDLVCSEYIGNIQNSLTEHLFAERGYRIDFDYRVVMNPKRYSGRSVSEKIINASAQITTPESTPVLVRLFLSDAERREYAFTEVGSGLGYILPVLCAVWRPKVTLVNIQQPELHLHPAMQAGLADIFIEASKGNRQLLIETHSEHLLLRTLRRIRQTHSGKVLDARLTLNAHDCVVVYFNPRPDGSTTVRQLRISDDGEFIDRWPRGFFTERDEEIFDE